MTTNSEEMQNKIIEVLEGILCSAFISGFISAHNQVALLALKRPLNDGEAEKLEQTAYASLNTFMSMYISNPVNKQLLQETFGICLDEVEDRIRQYLKSKIVPEEKSN